VGEVALPSGRFRVVDESYNASPASVRAALAVIALMQPDAGGRRIAVLGDMLELGSDAVALHAGLADALIRSRVDLVFTAGPLMHHLHAALPATLRGAHADDSATLAPLVAAAAGPGDVVLVKGSAGSRTGLVVQALHALAPTAERPHAV
jgi:UDP-N-acetylmuramoyl-tripeptide--D-alanyl-D-alanine ligase